MSCVNWQKRRNNWDIQPDWIIFTPGVNMALVYAPHKHVPLAAISEEFAENCIVCTSPSKTFNLAGLLVSDIIIFACSRARLAEALERIEKAVKDR